MDSKYLLAMLLCCVLLQLKPSLGAQQKLELKYHNGVLLKGRYTVDILWYGSFTPIQRSIIVDFINSLSFPSGAQSPTVASWWQTTEKYKGGGTTTLAVGKQIMEPYSLGKHLSEKQLYDLASRIKDLSAISLVLTAKDVAVDGFCSGRCGTHKSISGMTPYVWVGNSETQCPGQCAWPFHKPISGPQTPPLVAPNGDVGVDGMIINIATLLAGTVTNPFNGGYYQGPSTAPLEAVSACTGIFGSGAYPGYPGKTLVDRATGASYNAQGSHGRKFFLPAMWDPQTFQCKTLV
ncbi:protein EXORDIUM-like 2 [Vigna unguiculata]|nr:protein EXORDIUM-like 2 [Vigna unguiculata]